ncbi:MAG TPA: hypothetical protein VJ948_04275 [Acidimicrobiia bacterium]|nr:hypothetical protein [Acidimicrobiia bacterium]
MTAIEVRPARVAEKQGRTSLVLAIAGIMALVVGLGSVAGGIFGAWYTYDQAVAQSVVTPDDAAIPETPVRGPFTMWAQSDIITHHQLDSTEGLYYAEMEREVPQLDEAGQPVLDENGEPVMVPNEARASWINATALTTALGLGIVSYALSAFAIASGLALAFAGYAFLYIRRRALIV